MRPIRVGVVGATGYTGSETVRWLLDHPHVELAAAVSTTRSGERLDEAVPGLAGFTDLVLTPFAPQVLRTLDAVFLATPHGVARDLAPQLDGAHLVIDLSGDHRHTAGWVYGMAEWAAASLHGAERIAVPGCFATAIGLAIAPLVPVLAGPVSVVAATGSTGSGATAKSAAHHPERFADLRAYKVLSHQHVPEVEAFLVSLGATSPKVRFVPWSAPIDRGILATVFAPVTGDPVALFADAYSSQPLIRLRSETPHVRMVRGTALCDLSVHRDGDVAVVLAAIDNLGKGAAGQAVQCLNLALGLPAHTGLRRAPSTP